MLHLNQSELSKSPEDENPEQREVKGQGSVNSAADSVSLNGDTAADDIANKSRNSSNSTLTTPPTTPNSERNLSPGSRTAGRSRSSSGGRKSDTSPSLGGATKTPGSGGKSRRPVRHGITWRESGRIEARDYQEKWYPAKIIELDDSDRTVLIHFDGWNSRFDEWITMDSERLRPATRHSDRRGEKAKAAAAAKAKAAAKVVPKAEHKVGDHVFAKWSDCRMYPAKVMGVNGTGTYDVLFYDGFRKSVQTINIRNMPPEVQEEYGKAGLLAEPKKIKQNRAMYEKLAEKERLANEEREKRKKALSGDREESKEETDTPKESKEATAEEATETAAKEESPKADTKPKDALHGKKAPPSGAPVKAVRTRSQTEDDEKPSTSATKVKMKNKDGGMKSKEGGMKNKEGGIKNKEGGMKRKKLAIGGAFLASKRPKLDKEERKRRKKEKRLLAEAEEKTEKQPESVVQETPKKPKQKKEKEEKDGSEKRKSPKQKEGKDTPKSGEKPKVKRNKPKGLKVAVPPPAEEPKPTSTTATTTTTDDATLDTRTEPEIPPVQMLEPSTPGPVTIKTEPGEIPLTPTTPSVPPKAFLIEDDHNKYKCPYPDCKKAFRKKSLVDSHVKYYHAKDGTPIHAPPPKKRKKTISVCSETDSEISVGGSRASIGKARKKMRDSIGSVPSTPSTPLETSSVSAVTSPAASGTAPPPPPPVMKESSEIKVEQGMDDSIVPDNTSEVETRSTTTTTEGYEHQAEVLHEESVDTAEDPDSPHDRLAKDEVVNCICQLNEENGLMIQCDVCLCWQHALCMDITEETLPKKYLCYVCLNPPGVRESARFVHDQDWLKQGTLARFNFLSEESSAPQKAQIMKATHELAGDMQNINMVLDSLRRKIHALKNRFHPEFRMWTKDWDKEAERVKEEDAQDDLKQESFENDNNLISVDDDFSQLIGSEMLEKLARASLEILSAQGAGGESTPGLEGAEFSLDTPGGPGAFSLDTNLVQLGTTTGQLGTTTPVQLGTTTPQLGTTTPVQLGTTTPVQLGTTTPVQLGSATPRLGTTTPVQLGTTAPQLDTTAPLLDTTTPGMTQLGSTSGLPSTSGMGQTSLVTSLATTAAIAHLTASTTLAALAGTITGTLPALSSSVPPLTGSLPALSSSVPPLTGPGVAGGLPGFTAAEPALTTGGVTQGSSGVLTPGVAGAAPSALEPGQINFTAGSSVPTTTNVSSTESSTVSQDTTLSPPVSAPSALAPATTPSGDSAQHTTPHATSHTPAAAPPAAETRQSNPLIPVPVIEAELSQGATETPAPLTPGPLTSGPLTSAPVGGLIPDHVVPAIPPTSMAQIINMTSDTGVSVPMTSDPGVSVPMTSDPISSVSLTSDPGVSAPPLLMDENSTAFSLTSDMTSEKAVELNLDTSTTDTCPEGEDGVGLPMDTSPGDDPVSEIMGSQDIAQALINPSMLDDVDPTKLLDDHPDDVSNSSTVTADEDPKVLCEQNLLEHILRHQDSVEGRLDIIEEQIQALESAEDGGNRTGETMRDLPRVKKIIHQLLGDLLKVKRMAMYH